MNILVFESVIFLLVSIPGLITLIEAHGFFGFDPFFHPYEIIVDKRDTLVEDLFKNYDKKTPPEDVTVELGLSLITLAADVPTKNSFHSEVLLSYSWSDPKLKWDPSEYGNHKSVLVAPYKLWKPEVKLLNSALPGYPSCAEASAKITSNGDVSWVTPCDFIASCDEKASSSDYDGLKVCPLRFGHADQKEDCPFDLQLSKNMKKPSMSSFHDVTSWNVKESRGFTQKSQDKEFSDKSSEIVFEFSVKRKPHLPFYPFFHHPFDFHF